MKSSTLAKAASAVLALSFIARTSKATSDICSGNDACEQSSSQGAISYIHDTIVRKIDSAKQYNDGDTIACYNSICAFLKGTSGLSGGAVRLLSYHLMDADCSACGKVPTSDLRDGSFDLEGFLVVDYVPGASCDGLCDDERRSELRLRKRQSAAWDEVPADQRTVDVPVDGTENDLSSQPMGVNSALDWGEDTLEQNENGQDSVQHENGQESVQHENGQDSGDPIPPPVEEHPISPLLKAVRPIPATPGRFWGDFAKFVQAANDNRVPEKQKRNFEYSENNTDQQYAADTAVASSPDEVDVAAQPINATGVREPLPLQTYTLPAENLPTIEYEEVQKRQEDIAVRQYQQDYNAQGDQPGQQSSSYGDQQGQQKYGSDQPGQQKYGSDQPGQQTYGSDQPVQQKYGSDQPGQQISYDGDQPSSNPQAYQQESHPRRHHGPRKHHNN
ncbi:MAG: hypothetical protein M1825_005009 [Sarcosagium campestre]|nr:MAG: hypothetical protein M1825_005009 [Sarcosagium campestre]